MKRGTKVAIAGAVTLVAGGGFVAVPYVVDSNSETATAEDSSGQMRPVVVVRDSLAAGTILSGTVSRGAAVPLNSSAAGVVTWLPRPGDVIEPGGRLLEVNGRPVLYLRGEVPLWRPLQFGDRGKDVQSLNHALARAGLLDEALVDEVFGNGTSSAISKLFEQAGYVVPSETEGGRRQIGEAEATYQEAVDARRDAEEALGEANRRVDDAARDLQIARAERVSPEDVVILDARRLRVASVGLRVGDPAGGEALTWTDTGVHVVADVTRSQQASLSAGDEVTVTLPDGSEVAGTISSVGGEGEGGGSGEGGDGASVGDAAGGPGEVTLRVSLESQEKASGLVGAAVRIEVTSASVEDALVVPVTALVALAEGGYAVEKVMPDSPPGSGTLIPVEVGLVAEAKVQVSSSQLAEGDEVLVP